MSRQWGHGYWQGVDAGAQWAARLQKNLYEARWQIRLSYLGWVLRNPVEAVRSKWRRWRYEMKSIKLPPLALSRVAVSCPFHKEETPSCCLDFAEKKWHCFGCSSKGHFHFWVTSLGWRAMLFKRR